MSNLENQAESSPMAVADPPHNLLSRIEIENFRGFRRLTLDGLQRVNLIVGKNNSGKTSLLESLAILCDPTSAANNISRLRGHLAKQPSGRLTEWLIHQMASVPLSKLTGKWSGQSREIALKGREIDAGRRDSPKRTVQIVAPANRTSQREIRPIRVCFVSSSGRDGKKLGISVGQAIKKQAGEQYLESILHEVDARITRIRTIPQSSQFQVMIDIGLPEALPVAELGQGIGRLVEIFSELIGADAQVAVIDEIENGIHHSCLIDVWRGIAAAATQFDVQVFATTHSYECIEAAHRAFAESDQYNLGIVQLFRDSPRVQGRVLDRDHIAAAIAGDIDLRG